MRRIDLQRCCAVVDSRHHVVACGCTDRRIRIRACQVTAGGTTGRDACDGRACKRCYTAVRIDAHHGNRGGIPYRADRRAVKVGQLRSTDHADAHLHVHRTEVARRCNVGRSVRNRVNDVRRIDLQRCCAVVDSRHHVVACRSTDRRIRICAGQVTTGGADRRRTSDGRR